MTPFEDVAGRARALLAEVRRQANQGGIDWELVAAPGDAPADCLGFRGRWSGGCVTVVRYHKDGRFTSRGVVSSSGRALAIALYPPDSDLLFNSALEGRPGDGPGDTEL